MWAALFLLQAFPARSLSQPPYNEAIWYVVAVMVFSEAEVEKMDKLQKSGTSPQDILTKMKAARQRRDEAGPSQASVYRFLGGFTYVRGREETRGRPGNVPKDLVRVANQQRRKLIKEAKNEYLVTWGDVHDATKKVLKERGHVNRNCPMPCEDWLARQVRAVTPVRARPGKRRIAKDPKHVIQRYEQALDWSQYPESHWTNPRKIHGYIDSKKFVACRNAKDKRLLRATKLHHHLRTPAEGKETAFVLPKKTRMLLGVPSIDVTAAVGHDGIFFWYVNTDRWNGASAAKMYTELGKALRKKYGNLRQFNIVEDGDPKGFQSGKGKDAKSKERIVSWTLPAHTPSWMPLDYCLRNEIEQRTLAKKGCDFETGKSYQKRLAITARRLPKKLVFSTVKKMKGNIDAVLKNKGGTTGLD